MSTLDENVCPVPTRRCALPWEGYDVCGRVAASASLGDEVALLRRLLAASPPPDRWTQRHDDEPVDALHHAKMWRWGRGDARVTLILYWDWRIPSRLEFTQGLSGRSSLFGEEIDVERALATIAAVSGRPAPPRPVPCCARSPRSDGATAHVGGGFRAVIPLDAPCVRPERAS